MQQPTLTKKQCELLKAFDKNDTLSKAKVDDLISQNEYLEFLFYELETAGMIKWFTPKDISQKRAYYITAYGAKCLELRKEHRNNRIFNVIINALISTIVGVSTALLVSYLTLKFFPNSTGLPCL